MHMERRRYLILTHIKDMGPTQRDMDSREEDDIAIQLLLQ